MKDAFCLNHNDPRVIRSFNLVGIEETYRQAYNNGGILPAEPEMSFADVKDYFNDFIPAGAFKYENVKKILSEVPVGTQAAFWRNTFYFKDAVSREEANEELFHAVVSTILSPQERQKLYAEGAKLINVNAEVKRLSAKYPQTYNLLDEQAKRERVIEEHLASLFVESFKNPEKPKGFIRQVFEMIRDFFGFASNRDYIETVFDAIKKGKYRNANVVFSENATPSTYILKGKSEIGVLQPLSESESEQVLRNLRAIYFDLKQTSRLKHEQLLNETFNIASAYYNIENPVVSRAFEKSIPQYNFETGVTEKVINPDFVELTKELEARIAEVSPFVFDFIEESQGDEITDENAESEYQNLGELTRDATEAGFDNISGWLKMYISTVGRKVPIQIEGRTVNFIEAVDQNRIYYGVARALNNSRNDFERFIKLIEFGNIDGNDAANAFMSKVVGDITGKKETTDIVNAIRNAYGNEYLKTFDASIINRFINPSRSHILQNILKGFDLWSRTNLFSTVSPESGITRTFDANVNNSVGTQMANWQQRYSEMTPNEELLKDFVVALSPYGAYEENLQEAVDTNKAILQSALGINVSRDTLRWLLINNTNNPPLGQADFVKQQAFADQIKTYASEKDIAALLGNIQSYSAKADIFSDNGIKSKLTLLAKINALFDESVFESSYKTADGKTKYGFQWKTFDLEFINNLQDKKFITSLMNNGLVNYRVDEQGNPVYLSEANDFLHNNIYLRNMFTKENGKYVLRDGGLKDLLPYMKLISIDGMRQTSSTSAIKALEVKLEDAINKGDIKLKDKLQEQLIAMSAVEGREGDGVTFTNMMTKDFDLMRLNFVVNEAIKINGKTLYPHYLGNLEAKRTADFVYLPELKVVDGNGITQEARNLLKEEIRKEYDRIRRVHKEIATMISENESSFTVQSNGAIDLTSQMMRDLLKKDIYEKYHTGTVIKDGGIYRSAGVRALEFTDTVMGILPKDFMKGMLTDGALNDVPLEDVWERQNLDQMLTDHWENTIFPIHVQSLIDNELFPNLDKRWQTSNQTLNVPMFKNFILSSFINTLSFNQLIHGDPAIIFKNDGADMYKRFGGRNAAIQSSETYLINPSLGITEVKDQMRYVVGKEFVSKIAYDPFAKNDDGTPLKDKKGNWKWNTIDQADAQNYATTNYKRYLLWSRGKLTTSLANALDNIEMGIPLTAEQEALMVDNAEFLNVDKTVAFNGVQYLKKSDFMLTKEFTSILRPEAQEMLNASTSSEDIRNIMMDENNWMARPDVEFHHNLRQNMEGWREGKDGRLVKDKKKAYDLYMPMSASKMLNINVFDPETGWNNTDGSIVQIAAKNYGLQLENPAGKKRIIDPSQMIEIIFNEQDDKVEVVYKKPGQIKGEKRNISDLGELYQQYLTKRDNSMFNLAYNELFDENGDFDAATFFPKAVRSLINSGADPQTIQIFQSVDGNGKPEFNPNIGITKDKFVNLLFAHITKGVLQQKVSGDAVAHVSSYGIKPVKKIRKIKIGDRFDYTWDVVRRNTPEYNAVAFKSIGVVKLDLENDGDPKVIFDPTLETDALRTKLGELYESGQYFFTDELRHLKPRYEYNMEKSTEDYSVVDGVVAYYSETLMPQSKVDQDINLGNRYSFGVRIPSQDKHSAVNIDWVDTIPLYYGNTAVTAKEIVALSGSDFDIDKLFVHKAEMYKAGNKWVAYGTGDKWTEYLEFLKDSNPTFKERYYTSLRNMRARDEQMDADYNEARDARRILQETKGSKEDIAALDKFIKDLEEEYQITYDFNNEWAKKPISLLKDMRLPTDAETFDNPYALNNEMLAMKQSALTNLGTLVAKNGIEASYKTPATMTILQELDKEGTGFYRQGRSVFGSNNPLPNHIFNVHSQVHKKNSTGKQNINPYVNGNLGLIFAIRGNFRINEKFQLSIGNHTATGFGYMNEKNQRVFDLLSSLISAATDEAKEQLNARFNLNLDGAVLAKTLVSLGFSMETSIAFVNQPVIQRYLSEKEKRQQTIYLTKDYKSNDSIIAEIIGEANRAEYYEQGGVIETEEGIVEVSERVYKAPKIHYGLENLQARVGTDPYQVDDFDVQILEDLKIVEAINSQLGKMTRFLKVKKGFAGGLEQLDQLNEAVWDLGIHLSDEKEIYKFNLNNPIATTGLMKKKGIPQVINTIENILPKVNKMASDLILARNLDIQDIKAEVKRNLKPLSLEQQALLEKDMDSYIFMNLYMEQDVSRELLTNNLFIRGENHNTVGQTFNELKAEVTRIKEEGFKTPDEELLYDLYGSSILKRLNVKTYGKKGEQQRDELKVDTFAKLSSEEQDTLITSFGQMIKNLTYLSDDYSQFKNLPQQMYAYWVMKDAFQNKFGSVAKIFPVHMFKTHSNSIQQALNGTSSRLDFLASGSNGSRDILKRLAINKSTQSWLKPYYTPAVKEKGKIHSDNKFIYNIAEFNALKDKSIAMNYPFDIVEGVAVNFPPYLKATERSESGVTSNLALELAVVQFTDGTGMNNTNPDFYDTVRRRAQEIDKLQYRILQGVQDIVGQSIMTANLDYIGLDSIEDAYDMSAEEIDPQYLEPLPPKASLNISEIKKKGKKVRYSIATREGTGEAEGYEIFIPEYPKFKGYVGRPIIEGEIYGQEYEITEATTGMRVGNVSEKTIKATLEQARIKLNNLNLNKNNQDLFNKIGLSKEEEDVDSCSTPPF